MKKLKFYDESLIIFLLDGYDEYCSKKEKISEEIFDM